MKQFHAVHLSVFCKEGEDEEKVRNALLSLVPFSLADENVQLLEQTATGFNEKKIRIFEIRLEKEKHTEAFIRHLLEKLSDEQKQLLSRQLESRLDDSLFFYIRLDKEKLLEGQYWITDEGNCFHIKMNVAAYPAKREAAMKVLEGLLKG